MEKYEKMKSFDPEIYAAIQDETNRQNNKIELIASENFVSERIMEANGSPLTNKYAEGYPGKRYYGGCEYVDVVETLAIERAKELFGADYANVQAHSGAQANMAVFFALLTPGDTVLSMSLAHGGHLSHGSPVNMSGKYFNIVPYGVTEDTNTIDYDEVRRIALECKPKLILAGASAYPRIIDFKKFADIASEVGAKAVCFKEALDPSFKTYAEQVVKNASVLADTLMAEGFKLVSGGTDNHLMLVNLTDTGVTGKEAEKMLDEVGITVNKNAIPFDTKSPFVTSGIRIGTPASTSRGFKEEDMVEVGKLIAMTIKDFENNKEEVKTRVKALCDKYPLYR